MELHNEICQPPEEVFQKLQRIIDIYYNLCCCKAADRRAYNFLFDEITATIATLLNEATYCRYGSLVSDVATVDSDMDLFVQLQDHSKIEQKRSVLKKIARLFEKNGFNVKRTLFAKVPVIRLCKYGLCSDLTICNNRGLQNSLFINRYVTISGNQSFKRAFVAIKAMLSAYGINNTQDGSFSSFAINILAINVALCLNLIPNLLQVSNDANPDSVTIVDCESYTGKYCTKALTVVANTSQNLSANLFFEFFAYYANFNFAKYDVQINSNQLIKKSMEEPIVVLDPFDCRCNLTKNVTITARNKFKELCVMMENNPLSRIDLLKIDENMLLDEVANETTIPLSEKSYFEIVDNLERDFNFQHGKAKSLVKEWMNVHNSVYCKLPRAWISSQNFKLQLCELIKSFAEINISTQQITVALGEIVFIQPVKADVSLGICAAFNKIDKSRPLLQFRERWNLTDDLANLSFFSCNFWPAKKALKN